MKRFYGVCMSILLTVGLVFFLDSFVSASETATIQDVPSWVLNSKFKGDVRLRWQSEEREGNSNNVQHRERIRWRWGATHKITDTLTVGWRIASGGTSNNSTNATFTGYFANKSLGLDKAYFDWKPVDVIRLVGGKYRDKESHFINSDLLWDGDITFEGQSISFILPGDENTSLQLNTGLMVLNAEANSSSDTYFLYIQPVFEASVAEGVKLKTGIAYYSFPGLSEQAVIPAAGNNTMEGGSFKYKYDSINPNAEISFGWKDEHGEAYAAKLIADMVYNFDSQDLGFLIGTNVGHKKVKKFGQWQAKYNYRYLERDSWVDDTFSDSESIMAADIRAFPSF